MEIDDLILRTVRDSLCVDCGARPSRLRNYEPAECEHDCDEFNNECTAMQKDLDQEMKDKDRADMIDTERRLTRDMINQWARR